MKVSGFDPSANAADRLSPIRIVKSPILSRETRFFQEGPEVSKFEWEAAAPTLEDLEEWPTTTEPPPRVIVRGFEDRHTKESEASHA